MSQPPKLKIPRKLDKLLSAHPQSSAIHDLIEKASTILNDNKTLFFPFYTDHGITHIQNVLNTIEDHLIPRDLWESEQPDATTLTPEDAALIIAACILHDIAMHVYKPGFLALISGKTNHVPLPWFNQQQESRPPDRPWPDLWEDFYREATRFSDRQLNNFLGKVPGIDGAEPWQIRDLREHTENWSEYDNLLIGEFIRRHHARLAHEIAHHGFPGLESDSFPILAQTLGTDFADLIGTVARSHGEPLRLSIDYLQYKFQTTLRPLGALAPYTMTLLRVSDYLQLDNERAPLALLYAKDPQSPISKDEWEKHAAVAHINYEDDNPIIVRFHIGNQHSLNIHLHLKELLIGLQSEMDTSTTVLSGIYGHKWPNVQLLKSQVQSNLNSASLHESLPYIPEATGLAADPQLLTLLVEPLYGNKPEIGIRELLQNALDAVREREHYIKKHNIPIESLDYPDIDCDILIEFIEQEDDTWLIRITDTGIGMTPDTIQNYFLRAGASFRNSPAWTKEFTDDQNNSQVLRSGHFGIGVYAAFLLGNEIKVTTRHISEDQAYSFTVTPDQSISQIAKIESQHGTLAEILVTNEIALHLVGQKEKRLREDDTKTDWFIFDFPAVRRLVRFSDKSEIVLKQETELSAFEVNNSLAWNKITPAPFDAVYWTVSPNHHFPTSYVRPSIACNGINIRSYSGYQLVLPNGPKPKNYTGKISPPNIVVCDAQGKLPLNILRDELLNQQVPFNDELLDDLLFSILSHKILTAPKSSFWNDNIVDFSPYAMHPLQQCFIESTYTASADGYVWGPWIYYKDGASILESLLTTDLANPTKVLVCFYDTEEGGDESPHHKFGCGLRQDVEALGIVLRVPTSEWFLLFNLSDEVDHEIPAIDSLYYILGGTVFPIFKQSVKTVQGRMVARSTHGLAEKEISDDDLFDRDYGIFKSIIGQLNVQQLEAQNNLWEVSFGVNEPSTVPLREIVKNTFLPLESHHDKCPDEGYIFCGIIELNLEFEDLETPQHADHPPLAQKWQEIIGDPLLPYDPEEREAIINRAAENHPRFKYHLDKWKALLKQERETKPET